MMQENVKPAKVVPQTQKRLERNRAIAMRSIMKHGLEEMRKNVLQREYVGFEMCYDLFCEFYSDLLKEEDNA
jgi:hypothetical protein